MIRNFICSLLLAVLLANVSFAQKDQLSDGARVLFYRVITKLSDKEKNSIYDQMFFTLNSDNKTFHQQVNPSSKIRVYIYPIDLNNDGNEQIFISFGDTLRQGNPGALVLFIKNKHGVFESTIDAGMCTLPFVCKNSKSKYPDLLIPTVSEGKTFSILYTWNGKFAYVQTTSNITKNDLESVWSLSDDYAMHLLSIDTGLQRKHQEQVELDWQNRQSEEAEINKMIANYKCIYYNFKMKSYLITHSEDKIFKWFTWGKEPPEIHTAAADIFISRVDRIPPVQTLAQECDTMVNKEMNFIQVAAIDLNDDGVCGLAMKRSNISKRKNVTAILICENGYLQEYTTSFNSDTEPKPSDFIKLITDNGLFKGDKQKTISLFSYDTIGLKSKILH